MTHQYACKTCAATRATVRGIESHVLHRHREEWRHALSDFSYSPFTRVEEEA